MAIIAAKFGGTSLCDADAFLRTADIVSSNADRRYIILSAPGKRSPDDEKVTDLFLRAYEAKPPEDQYIFAQIFQRYTSIRDRLSPSFDLEGEMAAIFPKLHASTDYAASRGEYLCAKLFSACFGMPFIDAGDIIFFDHSGAIDRGKTFSAVSKRLLPLKRAVIPGFYGTSPEGIKLFPRGGSDVSGAWIAAAVNADIYENWTDVNGVFSADPSKIANAVCHKHISSRQMRQMSIAGAKVLHPDTLIPLENAGIPTVIRNTFLPESPGTVISGKASPFVPAVTGCCPVYFDHSGCVSSVALSPVPGGKAMSIISVFGANESAFIEISAGYKNIHIIHMPEHIQIITESEEYQTSLMDIHRILVKNTAV